MYSPLGVAVAAALMALIAVRFPQRRVFAACVVVVGMSLALTTPLGANLLVRLVEARPLPPAKTMDEACPDAAVLVFLSGGMRRPAAHAEDFGALTAETIDRVLALHGHALPQGLTMVVSGGGPFHVREAEIISALMHDIGLRPERVRLEARSTSTRSGAHEVARMLPPERDRIILATSALHLPRAAWTFRRTGFEVCPWPLNSRYVPVRSLAGLWPRSTALDKSERALHELLGMLYYRLTQDEPSSEDVTSGRR